MPVFFRVMAPPAAMVASPEKVTKVGMPDPLACRTWALEPTAAKTWEEPLP